jgi:hypothetical protein
MRSEGTSFINVRVATTKAKLHESLDTNGQGFQLLSYDCVLHASLHVLYQTTYTTMLLERECEYSHHTPVEGSQSVDCVAEIIGDVWYMVAHGKQGGDKETAA